ncbi:uncharacterized protein EHS24_007509 [Apiotrichum porosum]|uniref:Uncharacterized protein n=1 Tax=Apiotrichum porosum TaxID=105984 RepID=A0A427XUK3_9TREE|nr:uncharacterized protein EHS24_007509 [Apiotrichum porosum]RSH82529.1 hypothetical protein EHS24_007509 [Apiotrichum porosum]
MPGASSASSALSAAIMSPFATRRSRQQHSPPPSGVDSCYGVRSLEGSVSWSEPGGSGTTTDTSDPEPSDEDDRFTEPPTVERDSTPSSDRTIAGHDEDAERARVVAEAIESRLTDTTTTPPPPPPPPLLPSHTDADTGRDNASLLMHAKPPLDPRSHDSGAHLAASVPLVGLLSPARPPTMTSSPTASLQASLSSLPPPAAPSPLLHYSQTPSSPNAQRSPQRGERPSPLTPASHALFDMLADAPSEPGSPASLASFPSYVASTSSLSRISSPADWDWRHPLSRSIGAFDSEHEHEHDGQQAADHSGSAELVLPTLALPNTSLHLGLDRHAGPGQGTRVALLAGPEHTRDVLGVLASRRSCVQLPHGEVGVVGEAGLEATIVTGLQPSDIQRRAHDAYIGLHALLNPSPTASQQSELEAMVRTYATSKDWIHLAVDLEDDEEATDMIDLVPYTTLDIEAQRLADAAHSVDTSPASLSPTSSMSIPDRTPTSHSGASTPLSERAIDDTPRPMSDIVASWPTTLKASQQSTVVEEEEEAAAGAAPQQSMYSEYGPEDHDDSVLQAVALLERILDEPIRVHAASAIAFFSWRPSPLPAIASPLTGPYTSPASSTFEGTGPMPTVARAQGGGEWEATLSRRLAHRRELDAAASSRGGSASGQSQRARGRGTRRRRSHSPPTKPPCPTPLFPRGHRTIASSVGLVDLFDGMFSGVRRFAQTRWGQVFFACAIAVAVGCGYWAVRTHA